MPPRAIADASFTLAIAAAAHGRTHGIAPTLAPVSNRAQHFRLSEMPVLQCFPPLATVYKQC
jgi:hypothetical protein